MSDDPRERALQVLAEELRIGGNAHDMLEALEANGLRVVAAAQMGRAGTTCDASDACPGKCLGSSDDPDRDAGGDRRNDFGDGHLEVDGNGNAAVASMRAVRAAPE